MEEALKIRIRDVNPHIVCSLCAGYFIDATTITECLHTFCKSCIVKYLQSSKNCPQCNVKVHETQPLFNLRADRTMQDIVFKLVPALFENEEKRKVDFYKSRGMQSLRKGGPDDNAPKLSSIINNPEAYRMKYDEQIGLCVERYCPQIVYRNNIKYTLPMLENKFMSCSIRVLVCHLKIMLTRKLHLPPSFQYDVLCEEHAVDDEMSMKQIFVMYWNGKATPMMLYYRIRPPNSFEVT